MSAGARGEPGPVVLAYPFSGRWLTRNSPAHRVPSHGTHLMGTTYAIDFIPVDELGRSAPWNWRAALATEAPETFVGFGAPILAPCSGRVVIAHDGEPDHKARRSHLTLLPYMLGQAGRVRAGPPAIAGNHVVIATDESGPYILLAHLQQGSVTVTVGDHVREGTVVGACGNSGNSTQPHLHIQATDSTAWDHTRGLPIAFRASGAPALPAESEIVSISPRRPLRPPSIGWRWRRRGGAARRRNRAWVRARYGRSVQGPPILPPIPGELVDPRARDVPERVRLLQSRSGPVGTGVSIGMRTSTRFTHSRATLLAAGTTYYLFLALFSVLTLAYALTAAVGADQLSRYVTEALSEAFPGLMGGSGIDPEELLGIAQATSIVGAVGLL